MRAEDPQFLVLLASIAANVRGLRARRGLTQEALAQRADQDLAYVQRVERAATNLSVRVLFALARALGVSPGQLLRPRALPPSRRGRPLKKGAAAVRRGRTQD